jgi:hypothetical protein
MWGRGGGGNLGVVCAMGRRRGAVRGGGGEEEAPNIEAVAKEIGVEQH